MNTLNLSMLLEMKNSKAVYREVRAIVRAISPKFNFKTLDRIYQDIVLLFEGRYPGYKKCNTPYHDLLHTTDCLLAQARLLHGAAISGKAFIDKEILLGLSCAFMHDTGYIQEDKDTSGTGAKHTSLHVRRSIDFIQNYCRKHFLLSDHIKKDMVDILNCTDLGTNVRNIIFSSSEIEFLGKSFGTADLVGQMADRIYLEKLAFLFNEFFEAKIIKHKSEYEFMRQTIIFDNIIKKRLDKDFDNVRRFMHPHFKSYYDVDEDLYETAIRRSLEYLQQILMRYKNNFKTGLRRQNYSPINANKNTINSSLSSQLSGFMVGT